MARYVGRIVSATERKRMIKLAEVGQMAGPWPDNDDFVVEEAETRALHEGTLVGTFATALPELLESEPDKAEDARVNGRFYELVFSE